MAAVKDPPSKCFQTEGRHGKFENGGRKYQCRLPIARIECSVVSEQVLSTQKQPEEFPRAAMAGFVGWLFFFPAPPVLVGEV